MIFYRIVGELELYDCFKHISLYYEISYGSIMRWFPQQA